LSSDFVFLLDEDGRISYANQAAIKAFLPRTPNPIGKDFYLIDKAFTYPMPNKSAAEHDGRNERRVWTTSWGDCVPVECQFRREFLEGRSSILIVAKRSQSPNHSEYRFSRNNSQLEKVFEDAGIGMVLLQPDATIRQVNHSFAAMLGYRAWECEGHNLLDFLHPADRELVCSALAGWSPNERFVSQIEARYIGADQRSVWTLVTISAISTSAKEAPLAVAQIQDITDQRLTVQALRLSQERFRDFASAASDWMWEMGPELKFSYFSRRLAELTGISSLKLLGRELAETDISDTADPAEFEALMSDLAARRPFRNFTYRRTNIEGREVWLSVSGKLIFSEDGIFQGYRGTGADITERVRTEEALRHSEERMRRSVIDAPIPAMIHAEDGEILTLSAMWSEVSGYGTDELATTRDWIARAYPDEERKKAENWLHSLYDIDKRTANGVGPIQTKFGGTRYWDFQSSPLGRLSDGRRYVISMAVDVTEQLRAQEQLRILSSATDQSKSAIAIADHPGIIQYVNRQYTVMTGYELSESKGRSLKTLIACSDEMTLEHIRNALSKSDHWEGSALKLRKNGEKYWESISIFDIRDETGNTSHYAVIMDDITDQKRTEFELQTAIERTEVANRAKSDFLANMSHELRTPMNAIIGFSEAMTSEMFGPLGSERYRGYIGDIRASAHHLLGIINDILDLSKIEAGKL
jgi:PAS domain S-box-containing protein